MVITSIEDINESSKWISIEGKVIQLWENSHEAITQTGLIADITGIVKFVVWKKSGKPSLELNETYRLANVTTSEYNDRFSISINKNTQICPMGQREPEEI